MRWTALFALSLLILSAGCSVSPGRSPLEIAAAHSSSGYLDRDYPAMQAELP